MAFIIGGRKVKRATTVFAKCLEAGARSAKLRLSGDLEVEWANGAVVVYKARQEGTDTRFDPQLDVDLKA